MKNKTPEQIFQYLMKLQEKMGNISLYSKVSTAERAKMFDDFIRYGYIVDKPRNKVKNDIP